MQRFLFHKSLVWHKIKIERFECDNPNPLAKVRQKTDRRLEQTPKGPGEVPKTSFRAGAERRKNFFIF